MRNKFRKKFRKWKTEIDMEKDRHRQIQKDGRTDKQGD